MNRRPHDPAVREALLRRVDNGEPAFAAARALGVPSSTAQTWSQAHRGLDRPRLGLPVDAWPLRYRDGASELRAGDRQAFGKLLSRLGTRAAGAITAAAVLAHLETRLREVKPATVRSEAFHLAAALEVLLPGQDWRLVRERAAALAPDPALEPRPRAGRPTTLSVPGTRWPAPIWRRWEAAITPGAMRFANDPAPDGQGGLVSLKSAPKLAASYGLYLGAVRRAGLGDAVDPAGVQAFIADCAKRGVRLRSIGAYLERLARFMKAVEPDADWSWIEPLVDMAQSGARRQGKLKDTKIVPHPAELWSLGQRLFADGMALPAGRAQARQLVRDGVMLAFLGSAPVRLMNLTSIRIGTNLVLNDKGLPIRLDVPGDETKNGRPFRLPIWPEFAAMVEPYLRLHHPDPGSGAPLWTTASGGPLSAAGVSRAIRTRTKAALGFEVNPHLVRDAVVLAVLAARPDAPDIASAMLQHADERSWREYGREARTISSSRAFGEILHLYREPRGSSV